ncbi:hypothetical protein H1S01_03465 [Heliobacterium chlorum]|uniref:Uncharacterized protein n=1 Tax=Heliobacterium chlorum TaxID=2698 RepID=A0ABR7SYR9_HELCL|nr:hypothetical protein [Heliobacterium chlorum]MBC9783571.1 hypothetical protein [Heliobacterium chlorum]
MGEKRTFLIAGLRPGKDDDLIKFWNDEKWSRLDEGERARLLRAAARAYFFGIGSSSRQVEIVAGDVSQCDTFLGDLDGALDDALSDL